MVFSRTQKGFRALCSFTAFVLSAALVDCSGVADDSLHNSSVDGSSSADAATEVVDGIAPETGFADASTSDVESFDAVADAPAARVPDAPTGVSASPSNASALVTFAAPAANGSPITGYTITSSPGALSASAAAGATSATVTGLTNGVSYTFAVTATNGVGTSDPSIPSSAVVPAGAPLVPTAVVAIAGDLSATVSWIAPSSEGSPITGYAVTSNPGALTATTTGATTVTVLGLTNGTSYAFTVTATNAVGTGAPSAASTAVTPAGVPVAPVGVSAVRGNSSAIVTFTASGNNGSAITGYTITSSPGAISVSVGAGATFGTVMGLTDGVSYTFTVTATNGVGTSSPSIPSSAVVPAGAPLAPTAVVAVGGDQSTGVSWTAPSSEGSPITGYSVTSNPGGVTATTTGVTGVTVNGLTNGTSYTFTVTATNSIGTSKSSLPSNAVVAATVPGAPGGLALTRGPAQMSLAWAAPSNGGAAIDHYEVWVNGVFRLSVGGTSATVSGIPTCNYPADTCSTSTMFSVYAHNAAGSGPGASAVGRPFVSYVADHIANIFSKIYVGGSCTGCHDSSAGVLPDLTGGSPAGYQGAAATGAFIYQCPAHDAACAGHMTGYNLFTASSPEYRALMQWVADGNKP